MDDATNKILNFWFSDENSSKWFVKDSNFDNTIKEYFVDIYDSFLQKRLTFSDTPKGALALVILLYQFPRNMFRNTPKSFATDKQAIQVSHKAIQNGADNNLTEQQNVFLYMPFMHSEELDDQLYCIELYKKLGREENLKFAIAHKNIIEKFGRFPHRNEILGRKSTSEEIEFLKQDGSSF